MATTRLQLQHLVQHGWIYTGVKHPSPTSGSSNKSPPTQVSQRNMHIRSLEMRRWLRH